MNIVTISIISAIAVLSLFSLCFVALFSFLKKQIRAEIKNEQQQFLDLAKSQFTNEQQIASSSLEKQKQAVETSVNGLKDQLDKYQKVMHEFEKDRDTKYGNLASELKSASQHTLRLQESTNRLNDIIGNVKLRGQWGERMAEDIIRNSGLTEGVNFKKQKQLGSSATKPDYTFLLPNEHIVNMDVKFPLDNYLKMVNADVVGEKDRYQKDFIRNVKDRVKEIQNREYINPKENTLDFVLLFIPNEQVFGLIQEIAPEIMDDAMKQKVVLCSPFTLYAMLSVIRQAYENFRFERDLKKIIAHIKMFTKHFETFKTRFVGLGKVIRDLDKRYVDIEQKSFKRLDNKMREIEATKKGDTLIEDPYDQTIDVSESTESDAIDK